MKTSTRCSLLALFFLLTVISAATAPSHVSAAGRAVADYHYIVFEVGDDGFAEPVFHRRVSLAHPRKSVTQEQVQKAMTADNRGEETFIVRVIDDREVVYRDIVPVIRTLRGEFHGEPTEAGFAIEHTRHILSRPAVTVRVPAVPDSVLEIEGRHRSVFSLDAIEADREALPLASLDPDSTAAAFEMRSNLSKRVKASGSPANRMDLLIMGDGYTAGQSALFDTDAAALASGFFSFTPYSDYENYVNTTTLFTASSQSGADHPPYNAACVADDPSCCADSTAVGDPLAGTYVNTAFDARFCSYNIHRLLVADDAKVLAAASAVPDWDAVFLVVNDTTYGGSGGLVAVASTNASAPDVVRHEYGHSFTDLGDEYDLAFPGFPSCSDVTSPACEANVTDVTTRVQIKWEPWIEDSTPVPTPEGSGYTSVVGLFEGARYLTSGMYRPRDVDCLMRALGYGFCEICSQAYVLKLYDGGWGVPASGIDIIEPGSESPPTGAVPASGSVTLSVTLLQPVGGPPASVVWTVDGGVQSGETGSSFTFSPPGSGTFQVVITATDATTLVHPGMAGSSLTTSRQWSVEATTTIFSDGFESGNTSAWSASVP